MVAGINLTLPKSTLLPNHSSSGESNTTAFLGGSPLNGLSFQLKPKVIKNVNLVVASGKAISSTSGSSGGRFYFNITGFPFPLGPFLNRRTIRTEIKLKATAGWQYEKLLFLDHQLHLFQLLMAL